MGNYRRHLLKYVLLGWVSFCSALVSAHAQYFGQNKVRYKSFDFKILKTEHFDIYYYHDARGLIADFGRMAERWYARLSKLLNHELSSRQPIILYASHTDFRGTTVVPDYISEATGGLTEALRRRIVMPLAGPLSETDHVLGHELVHAFQFDMATRREALGGSSFPVVLQFPLWFVEGMTEYLSLGSLDPHTAMWMRDAVLRQKLPPINKLDDSRYFPYRWGQALWAYICGRYGDDVIGKILKAAGEAGSVEGAITAALQISLDELSHDWHKALKDHYGPVLQVTKPAESQSRLLTGKAKNADNVYVSPVISPDGNNVVFFSKKDQFSIDLFLADVETGKIRRRLTQTAMDPYSDSLQFINSAGCWSMDGRKFAFGEVRKGRAEISIYDLVSYRITKRFPLPGVADILSASWSPDGSLIAFSAMIDGKIDLFLLELPGGKIRRLTDDHYAELHPAWSPDGKTIAISTDRFTSDASKLYFGDLTLALIDATTLDVHPVVGFPSGKHLGAQWSPDGSWLYFISDRDGIANVYRVHIATGDLKQITNLQTGVSGISKWSPAFSVAAKAERLIFSGFNDGGYALYVIDDRSTLAGAAPETAVAALSAGILPPAERNDNIVDKLLRAPETGMPESAQFQIVPYRPRLSLDYVAPPSVTVGMSNFGSMIGGGIAFYWSDLLGHHNLMTAFQTGTILEGGKFYNNLSAIAAYENQKTRWNWGFVGGQVPYLSGSYGRSLGSIGGRPVIFDQSITYWEISRQVAATLSRPFSRAQRIEFSAGFQNISFDAEAVIDAYSAITGEFLGRQKFSPEMPDPIHLGTGNAAVVYDTSVFGGTSPIMGQRYRFEVGAAGGTLRFSTLLADYRRYVKLGGPLTFAARVLHYGRYGSGSEDSRMSDLTIGYPSLVRGYQPESFSPAECDVSSSGSGSCPTLERLFGSRILVGNAEIRLPLIGFLGVIPSRNFPSLDSAFFYDVGMAYRSRELTRSLGIPRRPVSSCGATVRFNVLGYFIAQLSYVRANDRPLRRWGWEFALVPGF